MSEHKMALNINMSHTHAPKMAVVPNYNPELLKILLQHSEDTINNTVKEARRQIQTTECKEFIAKKKATEKELQQQEKEWIKRLGSKRKYESLVKSVSESIVAGVQEPLSKKIKSDCQMQALPDGETDDDQDNQDDKNDKDHKADEPNVDDQDNELSSVMLLEPTDLKSFFRNFVHKLYFRQLKCFAVPVFTDSKPLDHNSALTDFFVRIGPNVIKFSLCDTIEKCPKDRLFLGCENESYRLPWESIIEQAKQFEPYDDLSAHWGLIENQSNERLTDIVNLLIKRFQQPEYPSCFKISSSVVLTQVIWEKSGELRIFCNNVNKKQIPL